MTEIPFTAADLVIVDGRIYHLDLSPEELANDIIIVGDPERVSLIAEEYFSHKEVERFHRGLRTITGTVDETEQRVSLITSGMGTPSLEIVLNEIVALNEIDFETRVRKKTYDDINIIRVGTSGGLQKNRKLGTSIITSYAIGLDNSGLFVEVPYKNKYIKDFEKLIGTIIDDSISSESRFKGKINPYISEANSQVVASLERSANDLNVDYKIGITVSNSGFFANQGRNITRLKLTVPDIDGILSKYYFSGMQIENMEMESSFLLLFMNALGYKAGSICPVIANRRHDTFAHDYEKNIKDATNVALHALYNLRYSPDNLRD